MIVIERMVGTWRGIIAALVACVIVMAPLAAQAKMAQHTASHAAGEHRSHDHGGAGTGPVAALAAHDHADHNHPVAPDSMTHKTGQQHDHRDHHDGSCCGTYCHSGCIATVVEAVEPVLLASTYTTFTPVRLRAVAPDQPQRPPSIPLSI